MQVKFPWLGSIKYIYRFEIILVYKCMTIKIRKQN